MDIRIKTAEEFHDAHVMIEIKATDQREALDVVGRLMDAETVVELVAEPDEEVEILKKKVITLQRANDLRAKALDDMTKAKVEAWRKAGEFERERHEALAAVEAYRGQLATAEHKVQGYDVDRHTEKKRADDNKAWAERTEAVLVQTEKDHADAIKVRDSHIADAEATIQKLTRDMGLIAGVVYGPDVNTILLGGDSWGRAEATGVIRALTRVREIVGGPGSVSTPPGE